MNKPAIRLYLTMARTGGTVISRCLGSMDGIILLSEIHPMGLKFFDPATQADVWFGLLTDDDKRRIIRMTYGDYPELIALIRQRCGERARTLVIRDWTHLDFTGVPFVSGPSYRLTHAESMGHYFTVISAASVRHPIDQWLGLRRLTAIRGVIDLAAYLKGYRRFAEFCVRLGFIRYEDFVRDPDTQLKALCANLDIPFDPGYTDRWTTYAKVTGDLAALNRSKEIRRSPRRPMEAGLLDRFAANADYRRAIDLLGYGHPQ